MAKMPHNTRSPKFRIVKKETAKVPPLEKKGAGPMMPMGPSQKLAAKEQIHHIHKLKKAKMDRERKIMAFLGVPTRLPGM